MLTNEYLKRVYEGLEKRNANEPEFLQTFQDRFPILLQCTDIDPLHLHDCHIHIPPFLFFQSTPMM